MYFIPIELNGIGHLELLELCNNYIYGIAKSWGIKPSSQKLLGSINLNKNI